MQEVERPKKQGFVIGLLLLLLAFMVLQGWQPSIGASSLPEPFVDPGVAMSVALGEVEPKTQFEVSPSQSGNVLVAGEDAQIRWQTWNGAQWVDKLWFSHNELLRDGYASEYETDLSSTAVRDLTSYRSLQIVAPSKSGTWRTCFTILSVDLPNLYNNSNRCIIVEI